MVSVCHWLFLVACFTGLSMSLKCHIVTYGNVSDPSAQTTSNSLQECPIGANACVKTVDYNRGVFSKQCQIGNCTSSTGMPQAPANCFNSTSNNVIMSTCCCYGDGCNPSSIPSKFLVMVLGCLFLV
ncbi:unnamed protein product [Caenorhabditis bovis]|uniref:UPAR/Ly6 domain-containing protein n=1 Tax=Caenorhabditis bovis TaxID=2654633 RepID=A0A8S1E5T9_9PELO|nr:unnamed protein product [Caenorhabditis bovis]